MNSLVKGKLINRLKDFPFLGTKTISGLTILEEIYNIYHLEFPEELKILHPVPYSSGVQISEKILKWADLTDRDLKNIGLYISFYELGDSEDTVVIAKLPLSEWIEYIL